MHLYLAAFEQATKGSFEPDEAALEGLRRAWELACRTKERSLAEYIFERMEPYVDSQESMRCAEELQRLALPEGQESDREQLSTREKEIIVCVVKGMTNKQIAEKLFISTHTVITHRRNIAAKLQIHSPAGLTI